MAKDPLVSVNMITYNHAPYVGRAIEGVLMQKTDYPFELVIGEDCSTDGTREIVFRYAEAHPDVIRVVTSDKNVGSRVNGHRTISACRGKYVAWCEGDDYWHRDDKLELQVSHLESHDDCVMVHSNYDYHDVQTGRHIRCYYHARGITPGSNASFNDLLAGKWAVRTCTACARLSAVREVMASDPEVYHSSRFLMGDTPLWADLFHRGRFHYVDESLATYHVIPESLSRSNDMVKQHRFYTSAADAFAYYARKYRLPEADVQYHEAKLADCELFLAFLTQDRQLAADARGRMAKPSWRQRMLCWGAQSRARNLFLRAGLMLKRRLGGWYRSLLDTLNDRRASGIDSDLDVRIGTKHTYLDKIENRGA